MLTFVLCKLIDFQAHRDAFFRIFLVVFLTEFTSPYSLDTQRGWNNSESIFRDKQARLAERRLPVATAHRTAHRQLDGARVANVSQYLVLKVVISVLTVGIW